MIQNADMVLRPEVARPGAGSAVKDLFTQLAKVVKIYRLYPPGSAATTQRVDDLHRSFQMVLAEEGDIELSVSQFELLYQGQVVYLELDKASSLAFKLFRDGIVKLAFAEGLEREEVSSLLDVLSADLSSEDEDDLVTLLWEKNFAHISYDFMEESFDDEPIKEFLSQPLPEKGLSRASMGAGSSEYGESFAGEIASASQVLLQDIELGETVTTILHEAKERDIFARLLDTLLEIFLYFKDQESFTNIVRKIGQVIRWSVGQGKLARCADALALLKQLEAEGKGVSPEQRLILGRELAKLVDAEALAPIRPFLEDDSPQLKEALAFLRLLGPRAVPVLCDFLSKAKGGKGLARLVAELGKADLEAFAQRLRDPNPQVVKRMVSVLSATADPVALKYFRIPLSHPDVQVRREVVSALGNFPAASVSQYLITALNDSDYQTRIVALGMVEQFQSDRFAKPLEELIGGKDFADRPLAEKKRIFSAYGRSAGGQGLPLLEKIMEAKGWFKRDKQDENRACAVAGVEAVGGPEAVALLKRCQGASSGTVKEACAAALNRLTGSSA